MSQYYPDYSAGLAYKYPQAWTDEEKRNFNPSFLPKGLQPDNASSVHANGISLNVISIPEFPRPQARELKPKKVILPEQNG
ncbi:MAG TPA: hypothetical protein VMF08_07645 [Candidatus Sulfotelmatobacter sp.]|nr:hypothetical protein [Candidatus Sulfotelmatobacter sp.]